MILKRSELYTPIIMLGCDKKYLSIGDSVNDNLYPSANESYRFSLSENTGIVNLIKMNRAGYYYESYGIMYGRFTDSILAMIVEDRNNTRYLIASNSLKDAHLIRVKQSAVSAFGISRKNVVLMSEVELSMNFIFNLEYSMSDLDREVQQPIVREVLDDIKSTLPNPADIPIEEIVEKSGVPQKGDWVTITFSESNWAYPDMNAYVGITVRLEDDRRRQKFSFDRGRWDWCYNDGHFRHATKDEIVSAMLEESVLQGVIYDERPF